MDQPPKYATPQDAYADHASIKDLILRKRTEWAKGERAITRGRPPRLPRNTPTPVTNVFASTMDALTAIFARVEPTLNFQPGSADEPADRATADVAIRAIKVVEDEVNIRSNRQMLAMWVGLTGQAWLETGYDPDPIHGMRMIQGTNAQGLPTEEQVPIGKIYVDVVSIFEMYFDANG